ncbi:3-phenylpropionate/cinnamic acid dioxygenase subunit beta [Streptosporangium sp. 'caverna']|uniref:aromatic-ring-hydroxylating dioxygenase subunit beta n=1 Tax=Streptosporangium sp. 'caverna' TaxID=2202249 RepID=UPI0019550612|nr:3-phenylpropionate/cinnamic acid dioxygenase subunit beta [Streptosporangium sp. 'caverna']
MTAVIDPGLLSAFRFQPAGPVPFEVRLAVQDFLIDEAELLDSRRFDEWLALFTDDVEYRVPVRITRRIGNPDVVDDIFHFDENKASLGLRVRRLGTNVAWAEDPPSFTRRFVTNVRVAWGEREGELAIRSYLLLYRSRGDRGTHDLISGERHDLLRLEADRIAIARRRVILDQSTLGTKNLAIFF